LKRQKTVEHTSDASTMATKLHIGIMVVRSDLPEIVHCMLNLGADINDRDDEYRTPLHLAVQANRYSYATELIARGADILVNYPISIFLHN
jgi:ankyrin repeat protein